MRIVFLFVYYIDELPLSLTTRDLLLFLQEHVIGDQELQKFFYLKIHGLRLSYVEFDGFIRGFPSIYVDRTPELDKEVFELNEAEIPDDAELEALIEEANCNGCELVRLVQYSGIIPGDVERSEEMLDKLEIQPKQKLRQMSKGTREKVQLILTMSRQAKLYLLDEPIGGVDPAARDYILDTIIRNYDPEAAVILSTHLIADVERILDEVIFVNRGQVLFQSTVDAIREEKGKSVDALFREVYKC